MSKLLGGVYIEAFSCKEIDLFAICLYHFGKLCGKLGKLLRVDEKALFFHSEKHAGKGKFYFAVKLTLAALKELFAKLDIELVDIKRLFVRGGKRFSVQTGNKLFK